MGILMNRRIRIPLRFAIVYVVTIGVACTSTARAPDALSSSPLPRVVGYLASWGVGTKGTSIAALPARDLTHIY